jgi:plasmid maintenance system antidote protein VapI
MADILNTAYPGSIINEEFFKGDEQAILNRMHVHFPTIPQRFNQS